jgi:NUMOD4 motif
MTTGRDTGWLDSWWTQNIPPVPPDKSAEREAARLEALAGVQNHNWKPIPEMDGCTFSGYEASDRGYVRSTDRVVNGRQLRGVLLKGRINEGYVYLNVRCDNRDHKPHTFTMHKIVLTTFDRPRPDGMETCHGPGGPADNRWPENIRWDTKKENAEDQFRHGRPRAEVKPDKHCIVCGGVFTDKGRRCEPCRVRISRQAAAKLTAGKNLDVVTAQAGYRKPEWVWEMAVKLGGYEGSLEQAEAQGRTLRQRAAASVRYHLRWRHAS